LRVKFIPGSHEFLCSESFAPCGRRGKKHALKHEGKDGQARKVSAGRGRVKKSRSAMTFGIRINLSKPTKTVDENGNENEGLRENLKK